MSNKIYVVIGVTGEYSSFQQWFIKAFKSRNQAENFEFACNLELRKAGLHYIDKNNERNTYENRQTFNHPLDPNCQVEDTGTEYYIADVLLEENEDG